MGLPNQVFDIVSRSDLYPYTYIGPKNNLSTAVSESSLLQSFLHTVQPCLLCLLQEAMTLADYHTKLPVGHLLAFGLSVDTEQLCLKVMPDVADAP